MAYGLHSLNRGYVPNGTGRDWFFVGDFEYRKGRKTPEPGGGVRPERPKGRPIPLATEARMQQAFGASPKERQQKARDRWQKATDAPLGTQATPVLAGSPKPKAAAAAVLGPKAAAAAAKARTAVRAEQGRKPGGKVPRQAPVFETTYSMHGRLSNGESFEPPQHGAPRKYHNMVGARPYGAADEAGLLPEYDALMYIGENRATASRRGANGIFEVTRPTMPGGTNAPDRAIENYRNLKSTYGDEMGELPCFKQQEDWGHPTKHHNHSMPLFPNVKCDAEANADVRAYKSTYMDLGQDTKYKLRQHTDKDKREGWGSPARHHHASMPCFPSGNGNLKPGPEDHCASKEGYFDTTYGELGCTFDPAASNVLGGAKYDLNAGAYREYRFMVPPRTKVTKFD